MRVLHLEDDPQDTELVRRILLREWPQCEIVNCNDRRSAGERLAGPAYDVILSDFTMAGFGGTEALKIAKQTLPEVPFIFLSGTIGEDRAIEAIQAGAADYVLKDRMQRLVPVIRRAMREAQDRRQRAVAEEQLLRAQRMENIGLLAAGIAHDLNNILAPMLLIAPILREKLSDAGDRNLLDVMEHSAERGAALVRQILTFAHGAAGQPGAVSLGPMMKEVAAVITETFPKYVTLEAELEPALWTVHANPTQIHQVVLNLCVNARDAMPKGGRLRLAAANSVLGRDEAAAIPGGRPGRYVRIEVQDTGTGIPLEVLQHMWEPFFTTKGPGKGTGLGLSTARGIIESHHGFIAVRTVPGSGTTFSLYLPALERADAERPEGGGRGAAPPARVGRGELILVVDDEPNVRELCAAVLTRGGYRVEVVADGATAAGWFIRYGHAVALVICDTQMPRLDGPAFARLLQKTAPGLPILAMTGAPAEHGALPEVSGWSASVPILRKPFKPEGLLAAAAKAIAGSPRRGS